MTSIYVGIKTNLKNLYECMFLKSPRQLYHIISKEYDMPVCEPYLFTDFIESLKEEDDIFEDVVENEDVTDPLDYDINDITKILVRFEECCKDDRRWISEMFIFGQLVHSHNDNEMCSEVIPELMVSGMTKLTKCINDYNLRDVIVVTYTRD